MSRATSIQQTLKLPPKHDIKVITVPPTGDCFYDCIQSLIAQAPEYHIGCAIPGTSLLSSSASSTSPASSTSSVSSAPSLSPLPPLLHNFERGPSNANLKKKSSPLNVDEDASSSNVISSQYMRDYVADQLTSEQFELYQMYATAGVEDYSWMAADKSPQSPHSPHAPRTPRTPRTLEELISFARKSGKENGPGKCLWADEFSLRTVSDGLWLSLLIVDDEAVRRGGSGGRGGGVRKRKRTKNGNNALDASDSSNEVSDGRFISIGNYPNCVILHRSRRQHYNAVVIDDCPVINIANLPPNVRSMWPMIEVQDKIDGEEISGNEEMKEKSCQRGVPKTTNKTGDINIESKLSNDRVDQPTSPAPLRKEIQPSPYNSSSHQKTTIGKFYCGCAGFANSNWVGNFYPHSLVGHNSDRQLTHYQQHFSIVEINSTFYGMPLESTVKKWKEMICNSFKVVVKAPKTLTHMTTTNGRLDCAVLSDFLNRMEPLGDNLVCVLIQCPRSLVVDVEQLQELKMELEQRASFYTGRLAFEFRNEDCYEDGHVREFLKDNDWALAMHPNSVGRATVGTSASGRGNSDLVVYDPEALSSVASTQKLESLPNFVYVRLHGSNDEHRGDYTPSQLQEIAEQIHVWRSQGLNVYCFILNDLEPSIPSPSSRSPSSNSPSKLKSNLEAWDKWSAMPKNAKQLEKLVYGLSNERVPCAPKQPKKTMLSFFGKKT